MDNKLIKVVVSLLAVLIILALVSWYVESTISPDFRMGNTVVIRFVFVIIGLLIAFGIYYFTRENKMWEVGTREVVYMAIGAALYAILSYNSTAQSSWSPPSARSRCARRSLSPCSSATRSGRWWAFSPGRWGICSATR